MSRSDFGWWGSDLDDAGFAQALAALGAYAARAERMPPPTDVEMLKQSLVAAWTDSEILPWELVTDPDRTSGYVTPPDADTLRLAWAEIQARGVRLEIQPGTKGASILPWMAGAQPYMLEKTIHRLRAERGETQLQVDAVKVSHHGTRGNTSTALLRLLSCKHFLISTDGSGSPNHPHAETLACIIQECGPGVELWFNYCSEETQIWDDAYLKRRHECQTHYPKEGEEGITVSLPCWE